MTENKDVLTILLVDDDPFQLKLATKVLNLLGHQRIVTADNGFMALAKMVEKDSHHDIVICDLNMPEMDGLEFMRHVHGTGFQGGVILASGEDKRILDTAMNLVKSHRLNVLGVLEKPIRPDALEKLIDSFERDAVISGQFAAQEPITEEELRAGIDGSDDNELSLVFQPQVNIATGAIDGVETLARWRSAERGVLGPGAFIPLAEKCDLIDELTNEIYRKALVQSAQWTRQGRNLNISINFSVNSFSNPKFCAFLWETAEQEGVSPTQITLEVTETQAMTIAVDCLEALMRMRLKRFSLSIDDFGTGSSSMAQLKNIPFTELKIDRAFVNGATDDASALAILETSVQLAKKLNMEIVAEGAETREDWDLVERLGCDYVQGFYCARPMPNEDLIPFMDSWTGPHSLKV